jgi:hypothetical protein
MQIGDRVKVIERTHVLFSTTGEIKAFQQPDYRYNGFRLLVATDDGRNGLFTPEELRAA